MARASEPHATGVALLRDPLTNKGTAFTNEERDALGLRGLLPPHVSTIEEQLARVMDGLARQPSPLERYVYLADLRHRNATLYYRAIKEQPATLLPIVYTPTVGEGCLQWSQTFHRSRGIFITAADRGRIARVLMNWPARDVRLIVVTDGGRILGLGDLGANGMGIPAGKLDLYIACAGVHPAQALPIALDVGTDNETLRQGRDYLGTRQARLTGAAYDELIEEFIESTQSVFPGVLVQFEDFGNANAFRLLERYRNRICTFNDDIQGTGAMGLAGLQTALRITRGALCDQRVLFFGAGEAALGIADQIVAAMIEQGLTATQARNRIALFDSKGLVAAGRTDLSAHKQPYAFNGPPQPGLVAMIEAWRPTALIGAVGVGGAFDEPVLRTLAAVNERPIVFALSNPTSKSECTAEQAYGWTDGRAVFASGSLFAPVPWKDRTLAPGQANNAFIFPGVGFGAIVSGARRVTNEMFHAAARVLASEVHERDLALGRVFPPSDRIFQVAASVASAVAQIAWQRGLASVPRPDDIEGFVRAQQYEARYVTSVTS
jgi:malate dehydrogenase (oxaloacetate-decarboxylating)(NADP+)